MGDDGHRAVESMLWLLAQVQTLASRTAVDFGSLGDLPPVAVLDETFDAATRCCGDMDIEAFLAAAMEALEATGAGTATLEQLDLAERFFDTLSRATLRAVAHPPRRRFIREWPSRPSDFFGERSPISVCGKAGPSAQREANHRWAFASQ